MGLRQQVLEKLKELDVSPKRSLGQNFLVGEGVVAKIIEKVQNQPHEHLIEVGPGLGALTEKLREWGTPLQLLELDKKFAQYWRDQKQNVLEGDALRQNWSELGAGHATHVVGNLPYQISSSLVIEITESAPQVQWMTFMFQKEVAQRIVSPCDQKSYGLLSVVAQAHWNIQMVCEAGPNEFYPKPNIASRVLHFERKNIEASAKFTKFVKSAFAQRRKKLIKNISAFERAETAMGAMGLDENIRAEALSVAQFIELYERCTNGN